MAQRTAQIIIDVDDRSLIDLNNEIQTLEESIQSLKIGTEEWQQANKRLGDLKDQFRAVTAEARKLQGEVQKSTIQDQFRGTLRIAQGLVGTLATVSGAITLLGGNSKAFDEATAKATAFLEVMYGLNNVGKLFNKENYTGLINLGKGFGKLVTVVKGASTAIKASLAATGIGLLVVALGAIVANWDKIKAAVSGARREEEKFNKQQITAAEALVTDQKRVDMVAEKRLKDAQNDLEIAKQRFQFNRSILGVLLEEQRVAIELGSQNKLKQATEEAIVKLKATELKAAYDELKWAKEKDKEKIKASIVTLENEQIAASLALQTLKSEENLLRVKGEQAILNYEIQKIIEGTAEAIKKQEDSQIILSASVDKQRALYESQLKVLNLQIAEAWKKIVNYGAGMSLTQLDILDTLEAQKSALIIQEKERRRILEESIKQLGYEQSLQKALSDEAVLHKEINLSLTESLDYFEGLKKGYEDRIASIEKEYKYYEEIKKVQEQVINFDKKGKQYADERADATARANDNYQAIRDSLVAILDADKIDKGLFEEKVNAAAEEIGYAERIYEATVAKLENEKQVLLVKREIAQEEIATLEWNNKIVQNQLDYYNKELEIAQLKLQNAKNDEEKKTALEKVVELEAKVQDLTQQNLDNNQAIVDSKRNIQDIDQEILSTEQDVNAATQEKVDKETEVTEQLKQQAEWHERANDWLDKYAQEIDVVRQLLAQTFEFMAALQERKADEAQERIDELQEQLDELDQQEEDRMSKLDDYNELLKDANGTRYDELLRLIAQEEAANIQAQDNENAKRLEIEAQIKDEENKKLAAEARAAKWRKAQAIVDAVIQGALAVIKALPNVFLAVATGVLAAAGVATIAAQKTPPIPEGYAIGGFTLKGNPKEAAGIVHKNEYVVPAHITQSSEAQAHIAALEKQRMRGYATGGLVQPAISTGGNDYIDYNKMAAAFYSAVSAMPNPVVSVQKITGAQNEVKLTKQSAGL